MSDNSFETWGNPANMNLNEVLFVNIQSSPYFKSLYQKKTYHEVIDEIYNNVETLEPFMKGTTPSSAFCLLYKLWTLRLTVKQVSGMLNHTDSPYIRGIGCLYIRYIAKPSTMWDWLVDYLDDEEELQVKSGNQAQTMTIGTLSRNLLTQQKWCGTMLPRIPVPVARDITEKLTAYDAEYHPATEQKGSSSNYTAGPTRKDNYAAKKNYNTYENRETDRRRPTRSRSPNYRQQSAQHRPYYDRDGDKDRSYRDTRDEGDSRDEYRKRNDYSHRDTKYRPRNEDYRSNDRYRDRDNYRRDYRERSPTRGRNDHRQNRY